MSESLEVRSFEPSHREYIVRFVTECTNEAMDPTWITEVLTTVISDARAVYELWRDGRLVGVGVSIDGLETEGNAGELSVFTRPAGDPEVTARLLEWGEARARSVGRSRVDVPRWPGIELPAAVLSARGYRMGHVMYNMRQQDAAGPLPQPRSDLPPGWRWEEACADNVDAYYETLRAAWHGLPSAFVEPLPRFRERVARFGERPLLLLSNDAATPVAAFVRVTHRSDGSGELSSLGRHPAYRGCGLGEHLMVRGLTRLSELGAHPVVLEVAATNATGLALYQSFGFAVTDEMPVHSTPV